jgi:hypothetical protein
MGDPSECDGCPAKPENDKDECCRCPKCGSEVTRFVSRDDGKSWINVNAADPLPEAIVWRCLDCGDVFTVDPGIKCCDDIEAEIRRARGSMIGLEDDWDGEGSKPIIETTINRSGDVMKKIIAVAKDAGMDIYHAFMFPGYRGEVELLWKNDDFILSVDVPENDAGTIVYCGHDHLDARIKGKKSIDALLADLATWFASIATSRDTITTWTPLK